MATIMELLKVKLSAKQQRLVVQTITLVIILGAAIVAAI